jgi:two-component system response regulator TtrR
MFRPRASADTHTKAMGRGRVLIVDDDASVRRALARLLRAWGYEVEVLADAAAYLGHSTVAPPACLVLDISIPAGLGGIALFNRLAGTAHALPAVFITGHGDYEVRREVPNSEAMDVIYKPLDEHVLVAAIERALARSQAG